jgi:hypothetical protein
MRAKTRSFVLAIGLGLVVCAAMAQQNGSGPSAATNPPPGWLQLKVTISSSSEAAVDEFAATYSAQGFAVTRSTSVTETTSSGWSFSTASMPMFSRTAPGVRTTTYAASAVKSGAATQAQMQLALAYCKSFVAPVGVQCTVATTVSGAGDGVRR